MYLYRAYDRRGRLLYIGMTSCIYERVKSHRRTSSWYRDVQSWAVTDLGRMCPWDSAHAEEIRAIRAEDPTYNVQHSPRWRNLGRAGGWAPIDQTRTVGAP
ncbi:GIY-YIG nuclease family protein [Micromonospora sp. NBC_01813]|uniref:GIY-YIG nuclease family protein n=1 Tax=Micromonospora sp. NBC_01813 TaxID=2975988 RepID=UPI002DDC0C0B|nr:GIY-YIG nuclease family protein [Micromonospora sp. NBC_01813]WSA07076.1 GIY-YIG nuclease family protein [Micromonospora sp. NBC_01813]